MEIEIARRWSVAPLCASHAQRSSQKQKEACISSEARINIYDNAISDDWRGWRRWVWSYRHRITGLVWYPDSDPHSSVPRRHSPGPCILPRISNSRSISGHLHLLTCSGIRLIPHYTDRMTCDNSFLSKPPIVPWFPNLYIHFGMLTEKKNHQTCQISLLRSMNVNLIHLIKGLEISLMLVFVPV